MRSAARLREHVDAIAAGPRSNLFPETREQYQIALDYCRTVLTAAGAHIDEQRFTPAWHPRSISHLAFLLAPIARCPCQGANLIADLPADRHPTRPPLLLVAHLDTVRRTPGADDNASGVAVALRVAELAARIRNRGRHLRIALVDMEESGMHGTRAFLSAYRDQLATEPPDVVVMDSVGYFDDQPGSQKIPAVLGPLRRQRRWLEHRDHRGDFLAIGQRQHTRLLAGELATALGERQLPALAFTDPRQQRRLDWVLPLLWPPIRTFNRSDHRHFWKQRYNAVVVTGTANFRGSAYHRPEDTPDQLDYPRLAQLVSALTGLATAPQQAVAPSRQLLALPSPALKDAVSGVGCHVTPPPATSVRGDSSPL